MLKSDLTTQSRRRVFFHLPGFALALLAASAFLMSGCSMGQMKATTPAGTPVGLETATKQELVAQYNSQADAIRSVNAGITMILTAGSAYNGVIKQYHEVSGFLLTQRPSRIRVIGQLPVVGTNIFDMESDGDTFRIFIPPQNKFITGPAVLERPSDKPIENLRPQHLLDAIFWPAISQDAPVLIEETSDVSAQNGPAQNGFAQTPSTQCYVLTLVTAAGSSDWQIARKIWFDRSDLHIARVTTYDAGGKVASDIRYSHWDALGPVKYAHQIVLARPENDYTLEIGITKVTFNEDITDDRLVLKQPPGVDVVHVGDDSPVSQPAAQPGAKP